MNCYLCNQKSFIIRQQGVRDNPNLKVLECEQCGLVQLDSTEHISEAHYINSGMFDKNIPEIEFLINQSRRDDKRRFRQLKPLLTNKKILDFGCGNGGFLELASTMASASVGIELEQRVLDFYHDNKDFELFENIEYVEKKSDAKFDVITSFHVFEHLIDPVETLKKLSKLLEPNGTIVIEVPNSSDALITLYENEEFKKFTYWSQHLFLFNASTLATTGKKAGLRPVSITQFQRYPLSNHLHWLSNKKPGGHNIWPFIDTAELNSAYENSLARAGMCDTLIAYFRF